MTTSFSHLVRGQFVGSLSANPGGLVLSSMMVLGIPLLLTVSLTGRWVMTYDPMKWIMFGGMGYVVFVMLWWFGQLMVS